MNAAQQRALLVLYSLFAACFALALAIAVIVFAIVDAATLATGAPTERDIPPCVTEDSTGCYWDADTMGNGRGNDLVTLAP